MWKLVKRNFSTFNKHLKEISSCDNERLYENTYETFFTPLYNETGLKWLELIKKFNFKIFYFKTSSKRSEKLIFNLSDHSRRYFNQDWKLEFKNYKNGLIADNENVRKIKEMQFNDLYYIYEKVIPEVFYTFPRVESDNKYTFDFILIVNINFNLNNFFKINFNLIKMESVEELTELNLTYDKVREIFESRFVLNNNSTTFEESQSVYKTPQLSSGEYLKIYKNNDINLLDINEYNFITANWSAKNFDQEVYVKNYFKLLCTQIWSFDKNFYKKVTKFGLEINKKYIYSVDSTFLTINEMTGKTAILNKESGELKISELEDYNGFHLSDGFSDQDIVSGGLNKEFIKNRFINFDKLVIIDEKK